MTPIEFKFTDFPNQATVAGGDTMLWQNAAITDSIHQTKTQLFAQILSEIGGLDFQGTWNANTNTPTLTSSTGTKGEYFIVSVAGSTNLDGITDWKIGDFALFSGSVWQKVDNTDAISTVFGRVGIIVATNGDYNISQITNGLSDALSDGRIFVGNGSGVATGVTMSGEATIDNTGVVSLEGSPSFTNVNATGEYQIGGSRVLHVFGTDSTFVGEGSGNLALTGANNTGVGFNTLDALTEGFGNTVVGRNAGSGLTTGDDNTLVGVNSMPTVSTSNYNVAFGRGAGGTAIGANNTFIGSFSGFGKTTGSGNIFLGYRAGFDETTGSDRFFLGNSESQTPTMWADLIAKRVAINNTAADGTLHVFTADSGATANAIANDIIIENSVNAGMSILSPNGQASQLIFGTPSDAVSGVISWDGSTLMTVGPSKTGSSLRFTSGNGVQAILIGSSQGVQVGAAPTGGDKGLGTINVATDIFKNNTAYTNPDYALEHWAKGKIVKFIDNPGAREYKGITPIDELRDFMEKNHFLPGVQKPGDRKNGVGAFVRADRVLEKTEEAFIYITQIHARLATLEAA